MTTSLCVEPAVASSARVVRIGIAVLLRGTALAVIAGASPIAAAQTTHIQPAVGHAVNSKPSAGKCIG